MRRFCWVLAILLIMGGGLSAREKKAVIIIVDGIPKDAIERLRVPVI